MQELLDWGLVDVEARPGKGDVPFTYWDYRAGMMHKNLGMRIDYVLATAAGAGARRLGRPRGAQGQGRLRPRAARRRRRPVRHV